MKNSPANRGGKWTGLLLGGLVLTDSVVDGFQQTSIGLLGGRAGGDVDALFNGAGSDDGGHQLVEGGVGEAGGLVVLGRDVGDLAVVVEGDGRFDLALEALTNAHEGVLGQLGLGRGSLGSLAGEVSVQQLDQLAAHVSGQGGAAHAALGIAELVTGSSHPVADRILAQLGASHGVHGMLGLVSGLVDRESGALVPGVDLVTDAAHIAAGGEQVQHSEGAAQGAAQVTTAITAAAVGKHAAVDLVVGVAVLLSQQIQDTGSNASAAAALGEEVGIDLVLNFLHVQAGPGPGERRSGDFRGGVSLHHSGNGGQGSSAQNGLAGQLQKVAAGLFHLAHCNFLLFGWSCKQRAKVTAILFTC